MPLADPKARKAYNAAYAKKHSKRLKRYQENYRKTHRRKNRLYLREWKRAHPNYDKVWRAANRLKKNKNQQTYRRRHPEKIRVLNAVYATRKTKAGGRFTEKQWLDLCKKYGNLCLRCNNKRKLTPDHVVPVSKGGTSNIGNIQPLCQPCNSAKNAKTTDYRKRRRCHKQSQ